MPNCDCKPGTGDGVLMTMPPEVAKERLRRTIKVDRCIAAVIFSLWNNGISTLGSCCGHNKANPSVVVEAGYDKEQLDRIVQIIDKVDKREWDVQRWMLVTH